MVPAIRDFRRLLQQRSAERVVPTAHGVGFLAESVPNVYDANYLSVEEVTADADTFAAEADELLQHVHHRRVIVENGDDRVAASFADAGYQRSTHLVMLHRTEPDRRVDTSAIREVSFEQLEAIRTAATLAEPWGDEAIARELNDAKKLVIAAVDVRFLAAVVDGEIAAYCDLRYADGVSQIEDVNVVPRLRGRGLGRALIQHALAEGAANGLVYLEALADDWPRELYAKLGFGTVGRRDFYTRFPHPLTRLRLRTPRLELRLPTLAEIRQLYAVAEAGIHDAASMPFGVAWTDTLEETAFVDHYTQRLETSNPASWTLNFVAFENGRPAGAQALRGRDFAKTHVVDTGSWLGREFQNRGLGTEMRCAVLQFAFEQLGAEVATSGAIEGNPQSLGVSRKLGYDVVGSHKVSPRGIPVEHIDLELTRRRFRPTSPTEVEGFDETLLPWFGAERL
jgi:RimJ/RimL family protein N-acetyltransferase/predicted GNAT family acetyltransferase